MGQNFIAQLEKPVPCALCGKRPHVNVEEENAAVLWANQSELVVKTLYLVAVALDSHSLVVGQHLSEDDAFGNSPKLLCVRIQFWLWMWLLVRAHSLAMVRTVNVQAPLSSPVMTVQSLEVDRARQQRRADVRTTVAIGL